MKRIHHVVVETTANEDYESTVETRYELETAADKASNSRPDVLIQIGEGTGRAWRNRINNPRRMNGEQYFYLCQRLRQNPSDLLARALTTRDTTRR